MDETYLETPPVLPTRGQLDVVQEAALRLVAEQPGISQGDLVARLEEQTGTPAAAGLEAVRGLDRDGAVASRRNGRSKIYAPIGSEAALAAGGPAREAVLAAVAEEEGIGQSALTERLRDSHGLPSSAIVAAVRALERDGVIGSRRGRRKAYVLAETLAAEQVSGSTGGKSVRSASPAVNGDRVVPTPEAIGRGQAGALAAFYDGRAAAVFTYCSHVAAPEAATDAVETAFANLFEAVRRGETGGGADLDSTLLRATRVAAADRALRPIESRDGVQAAPPWRGGRTVDQSRSSACDLMPRLLAARASGILSPNDQERMASHLARCAGCRGAEARFNQAERAFDTLREGDPLPEVRESLLSRFAVAATVPAPRLDPGPAEASAGVEDVSVADRHEEPADVPAAHSDGTGVPAEESAVTTEAADFDGPDPYAPGPLDSPPPSGPAGGASGLLGGRALPGGGRTLAAALVAALVLVGGLALLLRGGDDSARVDADAPSVAESPAPEPTTPEPSPAEEPDDPPSRPPGIDAASVRVSVLSGADVAGLAARTGRRLEGRGFRLAEVANAPTPSAESAVLFAPGARKEAAAVAKVLDVGAVRPLDAPNRAVAGDARVVVIAGADRDR